MLFVIHSPADPKAAVFLNVTRRAEDLRAAGHAVDIVTPADVGVRRMNGVWPLLYSLIVAARAQLSQHDVLVFHSHSAWAFFLFRRLLDPRRRMVVITTFHGLEPLYHDAEERELARMGRAYRLPFRILHRVVLHRLLRLCCRRSNAVFCLNARERDYLIAERWCTSDRTVIVGNGVERDMFVPRTYNSGANRILFVAQWIPRKGIRYLVPAFTALCNGRPDLRLVCAGTRVSEQDVLRGFPAHVRDRVSVFPDVDRRELAVLLGASDLFVFPSLFEGFSGALLEAMAAGLPVVATPAGAAADMLQDDVNGLLVPYEDDAALAAAVDRLLGDPSLRARLGQAARALARACEWNTTNALFSAALLEVATNGSAAGDRRPWTYSTTAPGVDALAASPSISDS